jgi:hypothetical protein
LLTILCFKIGNSAILARNLIVAIAKWLSSSHFRESSGRF